MQMFYLPICIVGQLPTPLKANPIRVECRYCDVTEPCHRKYKALVFLVKPSSYPHIKILLLVLFILCCHIHYKTWVVIHQ